jgi:ATP citrate (pro-S)-lyase
MFFAYFLLILFHSIIAEGVPESQTRAFNKVAADKGVGIIGPATVGGIKVSF